MNKDEARLSVMGAISMALKDPVLQQGFECICKENVELKAYNEKLLDGDIEKHNKIVELEKACAETQELLDKQIEATYKVVEELNKAKEIISEFIKWANWQGNSKCPSFKNIQDKAEAFLKEE